MGNISSHNFNEEDINNTRRNVVKSEDPDRYTLSKNLGLDPLTLKTTEKSQNKAINNPQLDSDISSLNSMNAPSATLRFMNKVKALKSQQRQNEIDTLKSKYDNITNAIKMYQQDEKQIWLNYNIAKDGSYMKKRQAFLINQKINKLRKQRDSVMNKLKKKYDVATVLEEKTNQLDFRNKYILDNQSGALKKLDQQISNIDNDIMTQRRQSSINMYIVNKDKNRILISRIIIVGYLLASIPLIFAYLNVGELKEASVFGPKKVNLIIVPILIITLLIVLIMLYYNHHRSDLDWRVYKYKPPKDYLKKIDRDD